MKTQNQLIAPLGINNTPLDYLVSASLSTATLSGVINYKKVKENKLDKKDAIKDTIKLSAQAGLVAGASIATLQYAINRQYIKSSLALGIGALAIFAVEKFCENENNTNQLA